MATVTGMTADAILQIQSDLVAAIAGKASNAHASSHATGGGDVVTLTQAQITGLVSDLANKAAVTHATSHATGGTDVVTLTQAQITGLVSDLAAKALDTAVLHKGDFVINVKDYGAAGDGTADDTSEIQAAIDASATGGIVYFPSGTYKISSTIKLLEGRTYRGAGRFLTSIKAANSSNLDAVVASETWLSVSSTAADDPINMFDMRVDGNSTNQSGGAGNGIALVTYGNVLENLEVVNNLGTGILLTSKRNDATEVSGAAVECKVIGCAVRISGTNGIWVEDPTSGTQSVTDGWIVNCIIDTSSDKGIAISSPEGWLVQGNHLYGIVKTGIYIKEGGSVRIISNYIEGFGTSGTAATYCGIMLGGDGATFILSTETIIISGNIIIYAGGAASGSSIRGIRLDTGASTVGHAIITNNSLHGVTHAAGSHAIRLSNTNSTASLYVQASGNLAYGWDTKYSYVPSSAVLAIVGDMFQVGIATTSVDGFARLPTCAGTPSGTPTDLTAGAPVIYDTTANKLWIYNGSWRGVVVT